MKLSLNLPFKRLTLEISSHKPEPEEKEPEHKCPTREEDFAAWKARTSSSSMAFGFAPKSQDFVNTRNNRGGRWTT